MTSMALSDSAVRAVKRAVRTYFPDDRSSHLTEAIAAACGYNSHAALLSAICAQNPTDPTFVLLNERLFLKRRYELTGKVVPSANGFLFDNLTYSSAGNILRTSYPGVAATNYSKSVRKRAWRNAMVGAINAGIEQRLFGVRPADNRWPQQESKTTRTPHVYHFTVGKIPAIASVGDAGWDELSIHVALWPTDESERWVGVANARFLAGELFAAGWVERQKGAWLQATTLSSSSFACRKTRLAEVAALNVVPNGYSDSGRFMM